MKTPNKFLYFYFILHPLLTAREMVDILVEREIPQKQAENFIVGVLHPNYYLN